MKLRIRVLDRVFVYSLETMRKIYSSLHCKVVSISSFSHRLYIRLLFSFDFKHIRV